MSLDNYNNEGYKMSQKHRLAESIKLVVKRFHYSNTSLAITIKYA